jgi:hypothetical protein
MGAKFLLSFFIVLFANNTMSQVVLEGKVFNTMDSQGLPAVMIINLNRQDTVQTKMGGTFSITAETSHQLKLLYGGMCQKL